MTEFELKRVGLWKQKIFIFSVILHFLYFLISTIITLLVLRSQSDFYVYYKGGEFSIDVFYPDNRRNLIGCLNSKMRKYDTNLMSQNAIIFLQMNSKIDSLELESVVSNKKNKLP